MQSFQSLIKRFFNNTELFTTVLLTVVALSAFVLGRMSAEGTSASPVSSHTPLVERVSLTSTGTTATSETPGTPSEAGVEYVGSKNSDKYHLPWCSGAQRINEENKIVFSSKAAAESAGYTPAGNCKGI